MRFGITLLLASLIMALPAVTAAQTANQEPRVTLNVSGMNIANVAERISRQARVRVVVDPGAAVIVDASLTNTPLESALTALTAANDLQWRRLLVPEGASAHNILQYFTGLQMPAAANVAAAATTERGAYAVLTGPVADKLWNVKDDLGLEEVYWIHRPAARANVVTPAVDENLGDNTAGANDTDEADTEEATPQVVYQRMTETLSNLPPEEALQVVRNITGEVLAAMTPEERMSLYMAETQPQPPMRRPSYPLGWGPPSISVGSPPAEPFIRQPNIWLAPSYPLGFWY